jgi:hypothetical protein
VHCQETILFVMVLTMLPMCQFQHPTRTNASTPLVEMQERKRFEISQVPFLETEVVSIIALSFRLREGKTERVLTFGEWVLKRYSLCGSFTKS